MLMASVAWPGECGDDETILYLGDESSAVTVP